MGIVEFLLARIADDEAAFREACEHEAEMLRHDGMPNVEAEDIVRLWLDPATGTNWPRCLAECKAKRRIIREYPPQMVFRPTASSPSLPDITFQKSTGAVWSDSGQPITPAQLASVGAVLEVPTVVRLLALPYADHPDYDEAWRI